MAETTLAFQAPSRLVALDLAHRLRARGWSVEVGGPAHTDDGRHVRATVPSADVPELRRIAAALAPGVVEMPEV